MENSNTRTSVAGLIRMTVLGSAFVGARVVLNACVPAFRAPVRWVERCLASGNTQLFQLPIAKHVFAGNPLTNSPTATSFMAINIVETVLVGVVMVGTGAAMKMAGAKHRDIERWIGGGRA